MVVKSHVILRPLRIQDQKQLALLANNIKIWNNLRDILPHPYTEEDARAFINLSRKNKPILHFAMIYKDEMCGVIGIKPGTDIHARSAELGYWIGEPYWGKGITAIAIEEIVKYAFENLSLVRIFAGVFDHNIASMRVLEKAGFVKEGIAEKAVFKNGRIIDEHIFARTIESNLKRNNIKS